MFRLQAVREAHMRARAMSSLPSPEEASKVAAAPVNKTVAATLPPTSSSTTAAAGTPPPPTQQQKQQNMMSGRPRRGPPVDPRTRRFFIAVGVAACALQISSSIGVIMALNNPSEE